MLFSFVSALETRRAWAGLYFWAEVRGGRWREGNILFYHFSAVQEEEFGSRRKSPSYDPQEFTLVQQQNLVLKLKVDLARILLILLKVHWWCVRPAVCPIL